jgi:hypothetical protein
LQFSLGIPLPESTQWDVIQSQLHVFKVLYLALISMAASYDLIYNQGAEAGDIFMSLIQTCIINKVNPAKYLAAILENKEHVVKYPSEWMPWNYTDAQISLKKMIA